VTTAPPTFEYIADPDDRDVVIAVMESLLGTLSPLAPLDPDRRRRVVDDVLRVLRVAAAQLWASENATGAER
jgi:hypothetical protein